MAFLRGVMWPLQKITSLPGGLVSSITSLIWNSDRKHSSQGASGTPIIAPCHDGSPLIDILGAIYSIITFFACSYPRTNFLLFAVIPIPAWAFVPGIIAWDVYDMIRTSRVSILSSYIPHLAQMFGVYR